MTDQPEFGQGNVLSAREHKFFTFFLGDELYGLDILKVREIIGMQEVTKVPCPERNIISSELSICGARLFR